MPRILGSRKRRFEVITNNSSIDGVEVNGEKFKFGKSGGFTLEDVGKANEINDQYGQKGPRDVIVIDTDDVKKEPGHTYMFPFSGLPFGRYDELGRRLPDDEKEEEDEQVNDDGAEAYQEDQLRHTRKAQISNP